MYDKRHRDRGAKQNWDKLEVLVKSVGGNVFEFERILQRLIDEHVRKYRNQLAHGDPVAMQDAQVLREAILVR